MRLRILSDLHAEFGTFEPPKTEADVVILAGDVHVGRKGRTWIRSHFVDQPVVYVLGNHEFYRNAIPKLTADLMRESEGSHIYVLENRSIEIAGVRFFGCTLWTDFQLASDSLIAQAAAETTMSDFSLIRVSPEYRKLRARDTVRLHKQSLAWLKAEMQQHEPSRAVIVTHHAPSPKSIPPYHAGSMLNAAFASDLEEFIVQSRVALWIHGHTHHCVDYHLGATRVFSNQRGYPDQLVNGFDPALVLDI